MRYSLVGFRDHGDVDQLQELPFTEDVAALTAKVRSGVARVEGMEQTR